MSGLHPNKTLVPVDFSQPSLAAVDRAIEIAGEEGTVEVVHVLTDLLAIEPGNIFGTLTNDARMAPALQQLHETFGDARYAKLKFHVLIGDFGREIADYAERGQFDLIVIPSHGYGAVKHMLLGSVAERVLRLAHCSVLVLRS